MPDTPENPPHDHASAEPQVWRPDDENVERVGSRKPAANSGADESAAAEFTANRSMMPLQKEIGGRDGPEPVRYGDWEKNGRCIDF